MGFIAISSCWWNRIFACLLGQCRLRAGQREQGKRGKEGGAADLMIQHNDGQIGGAALCTSVFFGQRPHNR